MKHSGYVILVTYGNAMPNSIYARTSEYEGAKNLKALAIELGYVDAKIVPAQKFAQMQQEGCRGSADSRKAHRRAS